MIVLVGDIHEAYQMVIDPVEPYVKGFGAVVIQVGDLGWWPDAQLPRFPFPVHFIDGNHDHLPSLLNCKEPTEVHPNLIYVPRGSILELDGRRVAFLGGGESIVDRHYRVPGKDWWPEEAIRDEDVAPFLGMKADLMVSHEAPWSVMRQMGFKKPSRSALQVEVAWNHLGKPPLFCGHLHQKFRHGNVTVLPEFGLDVVLHPRE